MNISKSEIKPPGKRVLKRLSSRSKWILLTLFGLILVVYGAATLSYAVFLFGSAAPTSKWLLLGIYSTVILSAGILVLGQASRFRAMIDFRRETRKERRILEKKLHNRRIKKKAEVRKMRPKTKNPTKLD